VAFSLTVPQFTIPCITLPQIVLALNSDKESGMKGNQFGLKPGERVALSEDVSGRVSDSSWYNNTKVVKGTVIGFDKYGYPVVFFDEKHKHTGFSIQEMQKNQNQPDARIISELLLKATAPNVSNLAFAQLANAASLVVAASEAGRCLAIYAAAAFRSLDSDGEPIRSETPTMKFDLVAGDRVNVSVENGKLNDQRWSGTSVPATVIGCNEEGAPILMLDDGCDQRLGWPLSNILNEDGTPRIDCTVAKSMRQSLNGTQSAVKIAARRCFYVYTASAVQQALATKDKEEMKTPDDVKKNFGLDFGDRIKLTVDSDGVKFDFEKDNPNTALATVIGFRRDDGTPIVMFDQPNEKSGWWLKDVLTKVPNGTVRVRANFSIDPNLLTAVQDINYLDQISGDYAFYIGNAETFQKINTKKYKGKTNMSSKNTDSEAADVSTGTAGILARVKKSAGKTPYRMARMQALTNGKNAILNAVKDKLEPNSFAMLEGILSSDAGAGAILALIGVLGPMIPKVGEDRRVQGLCEEFLDEGMAKGANEVLNIGIAVLAPALMSAVAMLPPVAEAVEERAAKKAGKRVATVEAVEAVEAAAEEQEEDEEEEETASSGKRMAVDQK